MYYSISRIAFAAFVLCSLRLAASQPERADIPPTTQYSAVQSDGSHASLIFEKRTRRPMPTFPLPGGGPVEDVCDSYRVELAAAGGQDQVVANWKDHWFDAHLAVGSNLVPPSRVLTFIVKGGRILVVWTRAGTICSTVTTPTGRVFPADLTSQVVMQATEVSADNSSKFTADVAGKPGSDAWQITVTGRGIEPRKFDLAHERDDSKWDEQPTVKRERDTGR